ncbi:solute carrier organic anion transporter family member 3A1 [Colossoma macropomum]|uniref:solute carrier organic anion transporter family member 3A1 n=1 Tax=Colossoma macropomum TaxID=42526 RepID=UPI001863FB5E|nr:solute carrier organic anion transporter family member 3A1 [Colossoma macropomum]
MQVKTQRSSSEDAPRYAMKKKTSCFSNIKIFLVAECALMLAQGTVGAYLVSVLTTLERRFNLQSADVGVIASSFEIGNLAFILFVSYFGARGHRPRLIGCGGIVMALGALLSALPEFLTKQYDYTITEAWHRDLGRNVCSNASRGEMDKEQCLNKSNTNMMYLLLIGAQVLLGIGATPVQPLGVSYIDDHVRRKDSSLYIGILFSTMVFGPACGFILGSVCTKFYVDAVFINTNNLSITPDDPGWIGAWWGGFLLCGALLFFSALFMFGFPSSLSERQEGGTESEQAMLPAAMAQGFDRSKPSNGILRNGNSVSCCDQLRVIPKVTKHLLSNPVFTCIILAACMEIAVVAGFAAFLGKYLEQQFNLTTASANQLLGMTAVPCACLGIFMSGLLVKKLNLSALGATRMAMLVNLISTACYVSFLFLGCDTGPVAGVTVAYGNETLRPNTKPEAACISNCNCYTSSVSPVCGSNGITYLSSCFAGCNRSFSTGVPPPLAQNLTGCACISGDGESPIAVPGKCPTPGCQKAFLTFLCVICACSMIGAMAQTPSVIILIRTVRPELKSYALGVLFLLLRLLGFIPPPLIFGAGIDSTCLFWSTDCGSRGACILYDNVAYRHLYVSLAIVLKVIAFLLYTTTWQCLRRNYKKYIKNNDAYVTSTEIFSADMNLDSLGKDMGLNQVNRTQFIYNLEDHEWCENMESVL